MRIFDREGITVWREPRCIRTVDMYSKAAQFAATIMTDDEVLWKKYKGMADSELARVLRVFHDWEANGYSLKS